MKYKPDFLIIPYALYEDERITALDAKLYGIIYYFANMRNERCTASNESLAEFARTTAKTVQNSLTNLESCGYIRRIFTDEQKKHRLEVIPLVVMSRVSPTDDTGVTHRLHRVSPTGDHISNTNKEKNNSISSEEEIKDNNLPKVRVSGNTTSRESIKKEEYESVPVNEYGEEISPRKSKVDRTKELAIEQLFIDECVKRQLPKPAKVPVFYLNKVRTNMLAVAEAQELNLFFDWWFQNGYSDSLLNVHSAFSTASVNRFRGRAVVQSKKSNSKYDNIKTTKYEIS